MDDNPGVVLLMVFIVVVVLGALAVTVSDGDVASFTESMASIATVVAFVAVGLAAVWALSRGR